MLSKFLTLDFLSPYLGSALRHVLTMIAGVLISSGALSQAQASGWVEASVPVAVALVLYVWAQVGSWVNKAQK